MDKACTISEKLLQEVEAGNYDAFKVFYDIAYPLVYRFIHYFLMKPEDCEEVVSEVFYIIWKRKNRLPGIKDVRAWLYIVCREGKRFYAEHAQSSGK